MSDSRPLKSNTTITCYNCNEPGHYSFKCTKKIIKCTICNRLGRLAVNCSKLSGTDTKTNQLEQFVEKSVMKLDIDSTSDRKYFIQLKINGTATQGYVDLGSQCTLIRIVVEDSVIKHTVLIGHSFTKKTGIVITKTADSLIFERVLLTKLKLTLGLEITIQPRRMVVLPVSSDCNYSGTVYVNGTL